MPIRELRPTATGRETGHVDHRAGEHVNLLLASLQCALVAQLCEQQASVELDCAAGRGLEAAEQEQAVGQSTLASGCTQETVDDGMQWMCGR